METIVFVTVVPIFAPMTIGTAPEMVSEPLLTIPTISDVVVEELWKRTVAKTPINNIFPLPSEAQILILISSN